MRLAIREAHDAVEHGDVPIGAVVLLGSEVIAHRHNEREKSGDPTAHAEILALRDAAAQLGSWRLNDVDVVVTLEPCLMCAGALLNARVKSLIFGASDPKAGACGSLYNVCVDPRLNHEIAITQGLFEAECARLLTEFFAERRKPQI